MASHNIICMNYMHCITIFHEQEHVGEDSNGHVSPKNYVGGSPSSNNYNVIHLEAHEHWKQRPPVAFPYIVFFVLGILKTWLVVMNNWNWGPVSHPGIWSTTQGFDHWNQVLPTSDHIQSPGTHRRFGRPRHAGSPAADPPKWMEKKTHVFLIMLASNWQLGFI